MILYTIGCPQCVILEKKLDAKKIKYDICENVGIMENKGIDSVPVLEIDDKLLSYADAIEYVNNYKTQED